MTDDTSDIESMLCRFSPAGPDPALRGRVIHQARASSRWAFTEALAAMLLVGMTLAQLAASATDVIPAPRTDEAYTQRLALAISRLELPISDDEAQAMAQRLSAGQHLIALPLIHGRSSININGATNELRSSLD